MRSKKIFLISLFVILPMLGFAQENANGFTSLWAESAKTAIGFFWKTGWAFVLGYMISAMI